MIIISRGGNRSKKKSGFSFGIYFHSTSSSGVENIYVTRPLKKKKFRAIYLSVVEFYDSNLFIHKLKVLDPSFRYTILFRVCFGLQPSYKMLGEQVGLDFEQSTLQDIRDKVLITLQSTMENYNFNGDDIITIQLLVYQVEYSNTVHKSPKLDLSLVSLGDNRDLVSGSRGNVNLVLKKVIPQCMDLTIYGEKLKTNIEDGKIKSVLYKDNWLELPSLIAKNNIKERNIILDKTTQIFSPQDKYLVSVNTPSVKEHDIDVFTTEGRHILNLHDKEVNSSIFTRVTGNVTKTVDTNSGTIATSLKVKFDNINAAPKTYLHKQLSISDPKVGSLDLEAYTNNEDISKVYAIGFHTKQGGSKTFYINEQLDSNDVVLRCIDSMLVAKYTGFTFYVHNMGGYDFYFLLKILINANLKEERYKLDIFTKDNIYLSLTIKARNYQIKLVDSFNILNHSLDKLGGEYPSSQKLIMYVIGVGKVHNPLP